MHKLITFILIIFLLVGTAHKEHPFEISTKREYKIKKTSNSFGIIKKALGLQSHDIHELTVLVSSDKIEKKGEIK